MWAAFIDWMREHNTRIPQLKDRAGFYGLDLYNMRGSIAAVLAYLEKIDPAAAKIARSGTGVSLRGRRSPRHTGVRSHRRLRNATGRH